MAKAKAEIEASKPSDSVNATDKTARALAVIPSWIKRPFVNLMFRLDNVGLIPTALEEASPWHSSAFLTNTGSIGIDSVYHHLYEFGTCSFFIAVGKKSRTENEDGSTERTMRMKFVIDERICDGHYYALSMRYMRKLLLKPEKLLEPPKQVIYDHEIKSLRRAIAKAEKKKA